MRSLFSLSLALIFGAVVAGCGGDDPGTDSSDATAQNKFAMPKSIVAWEEARGWGAHHLAAATGGLFPLVPVLRLLSVPLRTPTGSPHPPGRGAPGGW